MWKYASEYWCNLCMATEFDHDSWCPLNFKAEPVDASTTDIEISSLIKTVENETKQPPTKPS